MDGNNGNNLDVKVTVSADTSQIDTTKSVFDDLNTSMGTLGGTLKDVKKSIEEIDSRIGGLKKSTDSADESLEDTIKTTKTWLKVLKDEVVAGEKNAEQALDELVKKQEELNQKLKKAKSTGDNDVYSEYVGSLALVNKEINKTLKTREQSIQSAANQEIKIEKQKAQQLKQLWQEQISTYNNLKKQLSVTSSLNDFTSGSGNALKSSIFNSALQLTGIRALTAEFQNVGNEILNIDYNLINTQRIMQDFSNETANYLLDNAASIAKATNIQITDAQEIQGAWARINDSYAENRELLSEISMLTSKFMNVGEIEDAEQAVTLLNASLLQFGYVGKEAVAKAEEFTNKWSYMADKTAMGTPDEYGEAISKFGAQIDALGGSMDDAIALSSIMADRLAKNGAEAGNALKTFTTYLNRDKTVSLFSDIAEDLGDANYQLVNTNGRFKDFDETLRTVAQAYQIYAQAGNDAMAQDILSAVGATRQRDTALAILNSVNDGSYSSYLSQISSDDAGGYLDEQNAALLDTFKAKFNELKVSIEEFAMAFARSGVLDGAGLLMDGLSGLLSIVSKIPQPILTVVNAFLALKAAQQAGEYIGNLTGVTQKYQQLIQHGTSAQVEQANAISKSANAYVEHMEVMRKDNQLSESAISAFANQKGQLDLLTYAYNNGKITAQEYSTAVTNLIGEEQLSSSVVELNTQELLENTSGIQQRIVTIDGETVAVRKFVDATNADTASTKLNTDAKNRGIIATLSHVKAIAKETFETSKSNNAKIASALHTKIMNSSLLQLIASETATNNISKVLSSTFSFVGTTAAAASAGVKAFMSALNPILMVVSIGTTLWSLGSMFFGGVAESSKEASETLNNLQTELDETKTRLEELQDLERRTGLTKGEQEELAYLEQKNELLEKQVRLKQQEINNSEWNSTGGFLGFGVDDNSKEALDDLINSYKKAEDNVRFYSDALKTMEQNTYSAEQYNQELQLCNEELRQSAGDLAEEYYRLKDNLSDGYYSGDAKAEVEKYVKDLEAMLPTLEALTEGHQNLSDTILNVANETEAYTDEISILNSKVSDLNDLFEEYNKEGYLSYETVSKLVSEHPEYVKYLVKVGNQYKLNKVAENELNQANKDIIETTDELIDKLDEASQVIGQDISQDMIDAIDAVDNFTVGLRDTFGDVEGIDKFVNGLREINTSLLKGESTIEQYNSSMNELIKGIDFSKVNDDLTNVDDKTKQVAQSQQAMLTSLAQEVSNYMMEITNALFTGQMSATEYVNALQGSNQNILDMYTASNDLIQNQSGQWEDATGAVNEYANSLQNAIDGLNGMSEATQFLQEHQSILAELQANTANGMVDATWWAANEQSNAYQTMANDFSSLMEHLHTNNTSAWSSIVTDVAKATGMQVTDIVNSNGTITETAQGNAAVMGAFTTATMNQVSTSVTNAGQAAGNVLTSLGDMIKNFSYTIKFTPEADLKFSLNNLLDGKSPFSGSGLKLKITGSGGTSVQNFANSLSSFGSSLKSVNFGSFFNNIGSYTPRSYQSAGLNGLGGSSYTPSTYSGSKSDRNTPATRTPTKSSSSSGKSDAEKAAEEAAKAAEEAAKTIQKFVDEYVKNVESMQDRIAKALKKKYQEQYDERKKLLEKEHDARVAQIQAEIDAINGETPQDKQAELKRLQDKLKQWQQDNSTLGKARQKEYMDQIADLKKEIKLDELEAQLDAENEAYENSIDSESEFYDATLKKLDTMMSDEYIYKQANYLISNNKQQEIIDLLTKYDAQWDGWATLMGQTAGQIIAQEVALAIANYKDVKNGTITVDGGTNTNKVLGVTSSVTGQTNKTVVASSTSSSSKTISKGKRVKISNTGAGMYYTSTSKSAVDNWKGYTGQYYVVNTSGNRVALAKSNNISGAIGWIDKKYVVALATGGYTGNSEGLAYLHQKERVLSAQQTAAFDKLVYDFMPTISSLLASPKGDTFNNGGNVTFNKPLVSVNIDKLNQNKEFDVDNGIDNLGRMVKNSLQKSGINLKR